MVPGSRGVTGVWYLYIVRTADDCLYTGIATDVERRYQEHKSGGPKCARYLRAHKPSSLEFSQPIGTRSLALKIEYRFKKLPRSRKELIMRDRKIVFDAATGRIVAAK